MPPYASPPAASPISAWAMALSATLFVGALDYATGTGLGFFVFYFVPVAFAGWRLGRRGAFAVAALAAAVWFAADVATGQPVHPFVEAWNTVIRFASFALIGWSVARICALLEAEQRVSEELARALAEVRTLRGLLPMCAWCRQVRDDSGEWLTVEKYIARHSNAEISHGMCDSCAQKLLEEAGATEA